MKNTANYIMAALLAAGMAFSPPEAQAAGVGKYACIKNVGGGALSQFRIAYQKVWRIDWLQNGEKWVRHENKFSYSGWSSAIAVGRTGCIRLGNSLNVGSYFTIQVKSVAYTDKWAQCNSIIRTGTEYDRDVSLHVSYDVKSTIVKPTCVSGPHYWDKCNKCKYHNNKF